VPLAPGSAIVVVVRVLTRPLGQVGSGVGPTGIVGQVWHGAQVGGALVTGHAGQVPLMGHAVGVGHGTGGGHVVAGAAVVANWGSQPASSGVVQFCDEALKCWPSGHFKVTEVPKYSVHL
jgi:hypothetical protein